MSDTIHSLFDGVLGSSDTCRNNFAGGRVSGGMVCDRKRGHSGPHASCEIMAAADDGEPFVYAMLWEDDA